jgi:hypothetical protein
MPPLLLLLGCVLAGVSWQAQAARVDAGVRTISHSAGKLEGFVRLGKDGQPMFHPGVPSGDPLCDPQGFLACKQDTAGSRRSARLHSCPRVPDFRLKLCSCYPTACVGLD